MMRNLRQCPQRGIFCVTFARFHDAVGETL